MFESLPLRQRLTLTVRLIALFGNNYEFIGLEEKDTIRYSNIQASRRALGGELGRNACARCFTGQEVEYPTDFTKVD